MSHPAPALTWVERSLTSSHEHVVVLLADIPDSRWAEQARGMSNHAAWTLGHLALSMRMLAKLLGEGATYGPHDLRLFGTGSVPSPDRSQYPQGQDAIADLHQARGTFLQRLQQASPQTLELPLPHAPLREQLPTIGDAIVQIAVAHTAYHVGQLTTWRKSLDYPPIARVFL